MEWKPSHTEKAKATGPSIDSTTRKNVLSVSMTRAAAANISSSNSRNQSRTLFLMLYAARSMYMPVMVIMSDGDQPSSSIWRSNSSSEAR